MQHLPCESAVFCSRRVPRLSRFGSTLGRTGSKHKHPCLTWLLKNTFSTFFILWGSKWRPKRHPKRHQNAPKLTREPFGARFRENDVPAPPRQHPKAPKVFQIDPKMHPKGYPQASYTTERFQLGPHEARSTLNFGPNGPDPT